MARALWRSGWSDESFGRVGFSRFSSLFRKTVWRRRHGSSRCGNAEAVCVCVCARAGLASISQVADVVSGKWSSQGPRVEPERVVLTLAWSSLEGKVGAGEGPFRMDHQAGLRGFSTHWGLLQGS